MRIPGAAAATVALRELSGTARAFADRVALVVQASGLQPLKPIPGAVRVEIIFDVGESYAPAAGAWPIGHKSGRITLLADAVLEGLVSAGVIYDARQVAELSCTKQYFNEPCVCIEWEQISGKSK